MQDSEHHDGARDTRWRDDRMTGRRSHGRLSALNGVVHQGTGPPPRATHHRISPPRGGQQLAATEGRGPDTARRCAAARAQATRTGRSAIVAHAATRRADAADHGHAPGSTEAPRVHAERLCARVDIGRFPGYTRPETGLEHAAAAGRRALRGWWTEPGGAGAGPAVRASVGVEARGAEGVSVRAGRIRSGSPLCGTCARPTAQPQRVFMQQCLGPTRVSA